MLTFNKRIKNLLTATACLCVLSCPVVLSGCGITEEEPFIIVATNEVATKFSVGAVTRGDVVLSKRVTCTYHQQEEQAVSFSVSGKRISNVYVSTGDKVEKGQLLVQLASEDVENRVAELEYQIERLNVILELCKAGVEEVYAEYDNPQYAVEDCEDALLIDKMELERLKKELDEGRAYAENDGTITWVKRDLEGSYTTAGERVINAVNDSSCVFQIPKGTYTDYLKKDENITITINVGLNAGVYELVPIRTDEWGDNLYYRLSDDYKGTEIAVGAIGNTVVVLEERKNVLKIPSRAIHTSGEDKFVYVVGDGSMREVRWIETGLYGNDGVEIISGLEEGETVILK